MLSEFNLEKNQFGEINQSMFNLLFRFDEHRMRIKLYFFFIREPIECVY